MTLDNLLELIACREVSQTGLRMDGLPAVNLSKQVTERKEVQPVSGRESVRVQTERMYRSAYLLSVFPCISGYRYILFQKGQTKLTCSDCAKLFLAKCVKMAQADLVYLEEQNAIWRCDPCGQARRRVRDWKLVHKKALNVNIADDMIDVCHRVGSKDNPSRPRGIVVKFVRRTDKELLINKRREKRQEFSTRHIGLAVDKPTFLNESLSPARRRLLGQVREVKKTRGNIFMRVSDGSPAIEIKSAADLEKLLKAHKRLLAQKEQDITLLSSSRHSTDQNELTCLLCDRFVNDNKEATLQIAERQHFLEKELRMQLQKPFEEHDDKHRRSYFYLNKTPKNTVPNQNISKTNSSDPIGPIPTESTRIKTDVCKLKAVISSGRIPFNVSGRNVHSGIDECLHLSVHVRPLSSTNHVRKPPMHAIVLPKEQTVEEFYLQHIEFFKGSMSRLRLPVGFLRIDFGPLCIIDCKTWFYKPFIRFNEKENKTQTETAVQEKMYETCSRPGERFSRLTIFHQITDRISNKIYRINHLLLSLNTDVVVLTEHGQSRAYRPPTNCLDKTRQVLDLLAYVLETLPSTNSSQTLIVGDINIEDLRSSNENNLLHDLLASFNMRRMLLPATRMTPTSATSIDVVCTDLSPDHLKVRVLQTGISDHSGQLCSLHVPTSVNNHIISTYRNTNLRNLIILKRLLVEESWENVMSTNDTRNWRTPWALRTTYHYFTNIVEESLRTIVGARNLSALPNSPVCHENSRLHEYRPTDDLELAKIIDSLKAKSPAGLDEISPKIAKFCK
ncbi:hypothetical protein J6590_054290 [Homalodisca vitripennis]|nr:hypothetical protein J6590_054290 [Homalodisca vitripennis]